MNDSQKKTPPAATEGVDSVSSTGERAHVTTVATKAPKFWDDHARPSAPVVERCEAVELPQADESRASLTYPPGLVGSIAEYINNSARYEIMEGAILASLGLMAGVVGQCYNFRGSGLNLYLLLLAPTGRGKEAMAQGINRLLFSVRPQIPTIDECMGPSTFASGQGLLRYLGARSCFLSLQGEFGITLKNINDPRAIGSDRVLKQVLLDLYGKSGKTDVLRPRSYSDEDRNIPLVQSPSVSILGESTPAYVFESLGVRDAEDGLLPRMLILECVGDRPRQNPRAGIPPPFDVVHAFGAVAGTAFTLKHGKVCYDVQLSHDAALLLQVMTDRLDALYNDKTITEVERALWNRAPLNASRIAALLAIGVNHISPVIEEEHARWAIQFVELCVDRLCRKFRSGFIGSGETRQEAELRKYIIEFMRMSPEKRRKTYKVPISLCGHSGCFNLDYVRRRARSCTAFTDDRRGLEVALESSLRSLCKTGFISKLSPPEAMSHFGLKGDVYALNMEGERAG